LNRMDAKDGKLVMADGLNYNLLVLPNIEDIPENIIQKTEKLILAVANVLVQNPEIAKKFKGKILTNNKQVEFWDPVSSKQFSIADAQSVDGITKVNLKLSAYGSAFVVFIRVNGDLPTYNESLDTQTIEITSPWKLSFPENWGAPASVELDKLISWTDHKEKGINYFSGTASYENVFIIAKEAIESKKGISIDLGEVYDVAEILVNGTSAGILWTKPYKLNIEEFVKEGENKLEVQITNLWINRLTGDINLPEGKKFTRTNRPPVIATDTGYGDLTWRIQTSELLGPVIIAQTPGE